VIAVEIQDDASFDMYRRIFFAFARKRWADYSDSEEGQRFLEDAVVIALSVLYIRTDGYPDNNTLRTAVFAEWDVFEENYAHPFLETERA